MKSVFYALEINSSEEDRQEFNRNVFCMMLVVSVLAFFICNTMLLEKHHQLNIIAYPYFLVFRSLKTTHPSLFYKLTIANICVNLNQYPKTTICTSVKVRKNHQYCARSHKDLYVHLRVPVCYVYCIT